MASSRYPEDVHQKGHSSVWGSFYCTSSRQWGYACCLLCDKEADCSRASLALESGQGIVLDTPGDRDVTTAAVENAYIRHVQSAPSICAEESTDNRLAKALAEAQRILSSSTWKPWCILGLTEGAKGFAVRSAFRHIALLLHPDKNPGFEEQCKQALVRATEARENLERKNHVNQGMTDKDEHISKQRTDGRTPGKAQTFSSKCSMHCTSPRQRADFATAAQFIEYTLQYLLSAWHEHIGARNSCSMPSDGRTAAAAARIAGTEGILQSEAAFRLASKSTASLQKMLRKEKLGNEICEKMERMCCKVLEREYAAANQVYMELAVGNRAWHLEVPTLLEGGIAGCSGVERGRMFKQARTAQRLNEIHKCQGSVMDDDEVRGHVVTLRRLLSVAQTIFPNADPSKCTG